jgi:hypothetical protein
MNQTGLSHSMLNDVVIQNGVTTNQTNNKAATGEEVPQNIIISGRCQYNLINKGYFYEFQFRLTLGATCENIILSESRPLEVARFMTLAAPTAGNFNSHNMLLPVHTILQTMNQTGLSHSMLNDVVIQNGVTTNQTNNKAATGEEVPQNIIISGRWDFFYMFTYGHYSCIMHTPFI